MPVTPPAGLTRAAVGQHRPTSFRGVGVALNNIQRDLDNLFGKATSPQEQFRDLVGKESLQTDVGRLIFKLDELDAALRAELCRAQTTDDVLETQIAREKNRIRSEVFSYGTVAAGTGTDKGVFVALGKCKLVQITLVNAAALAADGTNNTKLELINRGADGTGTDVLATFDSATEAFAAFDAVVKTISGSVILASDDVLSLKKTETGAGAATTELLVAVGFSPIS